MIYASRIEATQVLGKAVLQCKNPPKVWINASSATIYRHALDQPMDELTGELGTGFSVDVCKKWEKTFDEILLAHTRKVVLRIAIVLSNKGGAFLPLRNLVSMGFGGKQGNGRQYVSWLHETDFTNIIDFIINDSKIAGVYNAAAPNPITNHELMRLLRKAYNRPLGIPLSRWVLEAGAFFLRTETELVLKSRRVIPTKLLGQGFHFQYENMKDAVTSLVPSIEMEKVVKAH